MVYFVGAGPGAEDLITVRGQRLLSAADVVIYAGSLINRKLLENCKEGCRLYDSALLDLEGITDIIKNAEKGGKMTVRLASGDPSIYGALHEMTGVLDDLSIDYEICPGVSSFLAAAAALKKEYMVPGLSQSLVITRAPGRTPVPESESISGFAAHGCCMVIFLSTSLLDEVTFQLLKGGYKRESPAAIVYRASREDQKVIYCTVGSLCRAAEENGISNTALVIAGKMLEDVRAYSKLYDSSFETGFRKP